MLMLCSDNLPAELRGAACGVVWSIPFLAVSTMADIPGRAMSLFYANPCIWRMGWGGWGDEQSGHVAPGGQAEWWRRRARSWCPCLGKRCPDSSLDCHQDTMSLRLYLTNPRRKRFSQAQMYLRHKMQSWYEDTVNREVNIGIKLPASVLFLCVVKVGTAQGIAMQRDTGVQSPVGSWRTQNMLTKIKCQVCVYAV